MPSLRGRRAVAQISGEYNVPDTPDAESKTSDGTPASRRSTAYRWLQKLLTSVIVLSIPFGIYWFWHFRSNAAFMEQRNYRALDSLARYVTTKLDNVETILKQSPCG